MGSNLFHTFIKVLIVTVFGTLSVQAQFQLGERDDAFLAWLEGVRSDALEDGVSAETLDEVLPTIRPLERVIQRDRNQAEVVQTYAHYLSRRVTDWRRTKGKAMYSEHAEALKAAATQHGVQSRFVTAIWGIETNYGTVPLSYSVFDAVATLAYDKRRADRFRRELMAALKIYDTGTVSLDQMKGSWAGAMGQPQFMPENYLKLAVDQDGDGFADIWSSKDDVFGSVANYLKSFGWRDDQTWGRLVQLPPGGEQSLQADQKDGVTPDRWCKAYKSMGAWRDLQDWQALGVRKIDGSDLPSRSLSAALIIGDEGDDQGYLVYRNFCSIMRYNPSFKYALSVGLLSDIIAYE